MAVTAAFVADADAVHLVAAAAAAKSWVLPAAAFVDEAALLDACNWLEQPLLHKRLAEGRSSSTAGE